MAKFKFIYIIAMLKITIITMRKIDQYFLLENVWILNIIRFDDETIGWET